MRRLRLELLLFLVLSACDCGGTDRCPGGRWVETGTGGACVIPTSDAGADAAAEPLSPVRGRSDERVARFDGLRMTLGPATVIGESYWTNSGKDLVARDGALWWMETNDRCADNICAALPEPVWWGVHTFRFRGDLDGAAVDVLERCEPSTSPGVTARMVASGGGAAALCFLGHAPCRSITCGPLGDAPGGFEPLDALESPRTLMVGERTRGVIVRWQHVETGEQGLRLYAPDGTLESSPSLATAERPEGLWVAELNGVPHLARRGTAGTPLVVDRLGPGATVLPSIALEGFPTDREINPGGIVLRYQEEILATFLAEPADETTRLHLVTVGADGSWGSQLVITQVGGLVAAAYDERGQLLVVTQRVEEATRTTSVELWRLASDGAQLEEPLLIEAAVDLRARTVGIEPGASRAWVVLSLHDRDDPDPADPTNIRPHSVHSVRSVTLP